ncbi:MAG: hypothetical protein JWO31_4280, partial [Phycisphaerales bacterium]|nr:hypothetical protein [Phycisphaerales bacterium]
MSVVMFLIQPQFFTLVVPDPQPAGVYLMA